MVAESSSGGNIVDNAEPECTDKSQNGNDSVANVDQVLI